MIITDVVPGLSQTCVLVGVRGCAQPLGNEDQVSAEVDSRSLQARPFPHDTTIEQVSAAHTLPCGPAQRAPFGG